MQVVLEVQVAHPIGHAVHSVAPAAEKVPAKQAGQVPLFKANPALHEVHIVGSALVHAEHPLGQVVQVVAP